MQWKKNTYINGHYSYCKITYINDIFYYEFCSSAQRSNIKSRLTSSLFGHLQIILGQISIKIFHRRFESEWLPRHTRPRRFIFIASFWRIISYPIKNSMATGIATAYRCILRYRFVIWLSFFEYAIPFHSLPPPRPLRFVQTIRALLWNN